MNQETIKAAALEYCKGWELARVAFLAGAEYMQAQKDDVIAIMQRVIEGQKKDKNVMEQQINQLVEFIEEIKSYLGPHTTDRAIELIQKHRP